MQNFEKELAHIAMSNMRNIAYIVDPVTFELLYVNDIAKKLWNVSTTEYKGKKCYELIHHKNVVCEFCPNKYIEKDNFFTWDTYNEVVDRHFEMTDRMIDVDGRQLKLQIGVDITDSKNQISSLQHRLTLEETLLRCVQILSANEDTDVAINTLLDTIGDFYDADRVFIYEVSEDKDFLSKIYDWAKAGQVPMPEEYNKVPGNLFSFWRIKEPSNKVTLIDNFNNHPEINQETCQALNLSGIHSMMVSPLMMTDRILGFLGVVNINKNIDESLFLHSVSLFIASDLKDYTIRKELEYIASVDPLTGLYNRSKYAQVINQLIADKVDSVGIVYLDINGLKQVNDTYGHEYGDKLILKTVEMMRTFFSQHLFRTGGDEFVILSVNIDRSEFEKKLSMLRTMSEDRTDLTLSIGSAFCTDTSEIYQQIAYADELMYVDKQTYYTASRSHIKTYHATVAADLNASISAGDFFVMLQPKVSVTGEKVMGAEALVRKKDQNGGFIPPDKFLPVYESDGIIHLLDFHVLDSVCAQLKKWKDDGIPLVPISVNFSRVTILEYHIAQRIYDVCKKHDIESKWITIELTEHISNILVDNLNDILEAIKSYGFKISLDDFGREYANLSILSKIAFNEIKVDKSLIDNLVSLPETSTALRCITEMCNAYRPTCIVVEGVETLEQVERLREMSDSITYLQGYFYSRPLLPDAFLQYMLKINNI